MQTPAHPTAAQLRRRLTRWLPILACIATPLAAQDYATPYTFGFFAGSPATAGSSDGTGSAAEFNQPYGIAIDSKGNLYVADKKNATIRKVTTSAAVSTLAGTAGSVGSTDATGAAAQFNQPSGVAVDSNGNLYVADTGNDLIRKITSAGIVTTLAGDAGTGGSVNGTGADAEFSQPFGVAVDSSGNVYVADFGNDMIRKITSGGVTTTVAGVADAPGSTDGTGTSALFNQPIALVLDSSGNIYVADSGNNTIRKITSAGAVTTLAGSPGVSGFADGTGSAALFHSPRGIAIDGSGNLYVTDGQSSTVRRVTPAGVVTTLAGTPGSFANAAGTGASALFDVPAGIALASNGTLYVASSQGYVIYSGTEAANIAPTITVQPVSQTIATADTVVFHSGAQGLPAPALQWYLNGTALSNGVDISGATGPTLVVSGVTAASAGSYTCVATNATGPAQSSPATLTVASTSNPGRLTNISCRAQAGTGGTIIIAGFTVGPTGTSGDQPVLIRGTGPTLGLAPYNVPGVLPDPQLQLYQGNPNETSTLLQTDDGWGGNAPIATAAASVGAFPWASTSLDSAILASLPAGGYTAQIAGASGDTGVALVEVYDATPAGTYTLASPRLTNLSARVQVGTGANVVFAGFVIAGTTAKTVLIRASGPTLALAPFNLTGTLPDPALTLNNVTTATTVVVASNTVWGGDPEIAAVASQVGAFSWASSSLDSALLVTLPPGNYTAGVAGAGNDTGIALVEVYEVP
jgi:sugar lactone lactonase YvrE